MSSGAPRAAHSLFFEPEATKLRRGTMVLFHGFTGFPEELESLAEALAQNGWRVILPCISGHGETIHHLRTIRHDAWIADIQRVCDYVEQLGTRERYVLGGLSFGSLVALCSAGTVRQTKPQGLVLLAPPFKMRGPDWLVRMIALAPDSWLDKLPLIKKHPRAENTFLKPRLSFAEYPLGTVSRMVRLRKMAESLGKNIEVPILILVDPKDHIVDPQGIDRFMHAHEGGPIDLLYIDGGEHELTLCRRYSDVATTVCNFVDEVCPAK